MDFLTIFWLDPDSFSVVSPGVTRARSIPDVIRSHDQILAEPRCDRDDATRLRQSYSDDVTQKKRVTWRVKFLGLTLAHVPATLNQCWFNVGPAS